MLKDITGVDGPFRAGDLMATAGTPIVLVVSGSQVAARMSRVLVTWSTPWPAVYSHRMELAWPGATSADQTSLDLNGGVFATPPFEVDLRPVLRVDPTEVASGDRQRRGHRALGDTDAATGCAHCSVLRDVRWRAGGL